MPVYLIYIHGSGDLEHDYLYIIHTNTYIHTYIHETQYAGERLGRYRAWLSIYNTHKYIHTYIHETHYAEASIIWPPHDSVQYSSILFMSVLIVS